tara:strand:- start:1601 stop:2878 length:1278 start_codon:yes stop_codon:yes gene_type:complete
MKKMKARQLKSKKAQSSNGKIYWRPRWAEVVGDETKYQMGKSQPTKSEADQFSRDKVDDINNRMKLQLVSNEEAMTVGQFAEEYWIKDERQISIKNKAQLLTSMKFWKEIGLWDVKIEDVTTRMMKDFVKTLKERGLVPTSIQNYKTDFRTLLDLAIDYGQISTNVLTGVKSQRRTIAQLEEAERIFEDMRTDTWSLEEIKTNLEKLKNIPRKTKTITRLGTTFEQSWSSTGNVPEILWYGRFLMGFYLGLRSGEILALKFSNIDFVNKEILINKSISRFSITDENFVHQKYIEEESRVKASSQRYQRAQDIVLDFINDVKALQIELGIYHEDQYIFVDKNGKRLELGYFRRQFKRIQELVGIERPLKSPKYTRHTSATVLAGLGWSAKDIADHLGHKNDRVTREYYIQSQSENLRKMADAFDQD